MYLAVLDDKGVELPFKRVCLFDIVFKMSPARNSSDDYSIINVDDIKTSPFKGDACWAAMLGVCQEVDSPPFVLVPLDHGRVLDHGEALCIRPGQLVFAIHGLKPSGEQVPDPEPKSGWERLQSRV